ncbi:coiled-coil domain-containing protein 127 isoform 2-T4 [Spheniscus humboldti]
MNNLNDPPNWNILPNQREPGDEGSRWNYALLVPMLGLAAFRWIWTRECQKEIEREKKEYYKKHSSLQKDLEAKYRDIITENRRTVAHLELELEKERNRTLSYREALVSQSRKLVEERRILEQEQEKLEREKQVLLRSGAAGYSAFLQNPSNVSFCMSAPFHFPVWFSCFPALRKEVQSSCPRTVFRHSGSPCSLHKRTLISLYLTQSFAFTHPSPSHGECHACEILEIKKRLQLVVKRRTRAGVCYYNFRFVIITSV